MVAIARPRRLNPNCVIAKDVKNRTYWGKCLRPKTGATHYHAQLELLDKVRAIKELVVRNIWDLEPLDLLNGLALSVTCML